MKSNLIFQIGLTLIPGIGPITAKKLISHCGSVEAVFQEKKEHLTKTPHIGPVLSKEIAKQSVLGRAEKEIEYMYKNDITATSYLDVKYPFRLKNCVDSPLVLFSKGNFAWVVDADDEKKLILTMKKASRLMIIANTDKGDQTTDHYSMMGFTKAYNSAKKTCS